VSFISTERSHDPLTLALSPKGERVLSLACAAFFFATLLVCAPASAQQSYSVSIKPPTELGRDERVAGFWIDLSGAGIRSVLAVPQGWVVNIDNLAGHVSVQGTLQEGAAALDPSFFRDFLVIQEERRAAALFVISGELILTGDPGDSAYDGRHIPLIGEQFELKPVP
jgi:hypothetical protein